MSFSLWFSLFLPLSLSTLTSTRCSTFGPNQPKNQRHISCQGQNAVGDYVHVPGCTGLGYRMRIAGGETADANHDSDTIVPSLFLTNDRVQNRFTPRRTYFKNTQERVKWQIVGHYPQNSVSFLKRDSAPYILDPWEIVAWLGWRSFHMFWLWPGCACGLLIDHRGSFLVVGEKLWIKKDCSFCNFGTFRRWQCSG